MMDQQQGGGRRAAAPLCDTELPVTHAARPGDCDAHQEFEDIYTRYRRGILHHVYAKVSDWDLAEDIMQETFLRAFKALSGMQRPIQWSALLYRIATNAAIDILRRRQLIHWISTTELKDEPQSRDDPQEDSGSAELMRLALAQMPEHYRRALVLYAEYGYSYEQIAAILQIAPGAIKMVILRARRRLKQALAMLEAAVSCDGGLAITAHVPGGNRDADHATTGRPGAQGRKEEAQQ
jgi:RNA polymerase sigma-70 factor (ECF subfamily)